MWYVRMVDVRYICDGGVEDIVHFLLHCGEFAGDEEDYWVWLKGLEERMAEWRR